MNADSNRFRLQGLARGVLLPLLLSAAPLLHASEADIGARYAYPVPPAAAERDGCDRGPSGRLLGGAIGALIGGAIGAEIAGDEVDRRTGAALGAAVGALIGSRIGRDLAGDDAECLIRTAGRPDGGPAGWPPVHSQPRRP